MPYPVGRVAELANTTVRTLHHYDRIGLVVPSERTPAGYRRYGDADLERLQRVLGYRELGFPLEEIKAILDRPCEDPTEHLRRQHRLLHERIERLSGMAKAIEFLMEAEQMGLRLTPEERFELFGEHDPARYGEEIVERWGDTEPFRESRRRAARYGKEQWTEIKVEMDAVPARFAELRERGAAPGSEAAMDLAEEHRQIISRWFYECGYDLHRGLAELYVADPRFTAVYDAYGEGTAAYIRASILANADRAAA